MVQCNPARYTFVASEGPGILFEFSGCVHLGEGMALIDEIRPRRSWLYAHGAGLCDECPVSLWKHQRRRYDARLEADIVMCVESYVGPLGGKECVKLGEQVQLTDNGSSA